jgi:hypothetical protein
VSLPILAAAVLALAVPGAIPDAEVDGRVRELSAAEPAARIAAGRALRGASPAQLAARSPALAAAIGDEQDAAVLVEALPLLAAIDVAYATPVLGRVFESPDARLHAAAVATLARVDGGAKRVRFWLARESTPAAREALEAALASPVAPPP